MKTEELVLDHMSLARSIACNYKKTSPKFISCDDLISEAYFGLTKAAKDYNGKVPFKYYAVIRITGEIKDFIRKSLSHSFTSLENSGIIC